MVGVDGVSEDSKDKLNTRNLESFCIKQRGLAEADRGGQGSWMSCRAEQEEEEEVNGWKRDKLKI